MSRRLRLDMKNLVNIHTHKPGAGICVVDPCLDDCVILNEPEVYWSLGIHPCRIDEDSGRRLELIEMAAATGSVVAVGEAGLDRNSETPLNEQLVWLERQADIALRYGMPLIVHVVRAVPELISVRKNFQGARAWIVHGFNNRRETLEALLQHGFYVSAGKQVMNNGSNIVALLPDVPIGRLFLETDDSDEDIEDIYRKVAEIRRMKMKELQKRMTENFEKVFLIRRKSCMGKSMTELRALLGSEMLKKWKL